MHKWGCAFPWAFGSTPTQLCSICIKLPSLCLVFLGCRPVPAGLKAPLNESENSSFKKKTKPTLISFSKHHQGDLIYVLRNLLQFRRVKLSAEVQTKLKPSSHMNSAELSPDFSFLHASSAKQEIICVRCQKYLFVGRLDMSCGNHSLCLVICASSSTHPLSILWTMSSSVQTWSQLDFSQVLYMGEADLSGTSNSYFAAPQCSVRTQRCLELSEHHRHAKLKCWHADARNVCLSHSK